ncbi:class E basic helix-loop-helix protein 23-like [Rhipicephalus sanguineus]|uniref:class E basic helix-loop-helix protein 23-like n=1 Tax=Rhipicephalus sanguineus TaxID=34632 RepID=UPI001895ED5F|nr:class E basic helix-loop-helix protein 23-like [Rhipicephalus sanguineus]
MSSWHARTRESCLQDASVPVISEETRSSSMFADGEPSAPDVPMVYQRHYQSPVAPVAATTAYERCCVSAAVLMRRPPYPEVATAAFYPLDDGPLSTLADHHRRPTPSYAAYDRSYVDAPPSSFLYGAAAYDCVYGDCPDCAEVGYSPASASSRSPTDVSDAKSAACPLQTSPAMSRRASSVARKRSLSQAELERRRSLANHQERRRMHRLNSALDRLRSTIPPRLQNGGRRLSKIKTLKMAINYILELKTVLGPTTVAGAGGACAPVSPSWD